jgi:hypothetical protein
MPTLLSLNKSIVKFFGYLEFDLDQINLKLVFKSYMSFVAAQSFLRQPLHCVVSSDQFVTRVFLLYLAQAAFQNNHFLISRKAIQACS